jgi:hypothetical protein
MPSKPCLWLSGPPGAKPGDGGENNIGFGAAQAVEVEFQRVQHRRRQVGDDNVGRRDEFSHDFAALWRGRVQGHAELVAVHREEHRAAAVRTRADRDERAVFAAADPLDADDLRAEVAQQRGAERPGDVAAEIENADTVEHFGHGFLLASNARRRGRSLARK